MIPNQKANFSSYATKVHYKLPLSILQLPMHDLLRSVQVRHRHNLNHQTCPACEMLRSLSSASLRVILFPREARLFPLIEDVINEIFPESDVDFSGLSFVWSRLGCNVLEFVSGQLKGLVEILYHHLHRGFSRRGSSCSSIPGFASSSHPSHKVRGSCSGFLLRIHSTAPQDR